MNVLKLIISSLSLIGLSYMNVWAALSPYDQNRPVGWATVEATPTGGEGGECVTVTNANDLKANLAKKGKCTIYIKGAIEFTSVMKVVAVDKTLIGLPGSSLFSTKRDKSTSGILYLSRGSNNFIMRNVTFISAGAYDCDGWDNFCIDGAYNIWIDHCDFQDGVDGNFDCKNGSNNIAVTWCRFRYLKAPLGGGSGGSGDHRFTNLWGSSDSNASKDEGKLNTTFQFCWWDEGCRERMPRVRFGKVHIINCLYKSSVANYCCGAGNNSSIYVERSAFIGVNNPYANYSNANGQQGLLTFDNCMFVGCSGNTQGTGWAFQPSQYYQLPAIEAYQVEQVVTSPENGAGATLQFTECETGGNDPEPENPNLPDPTLTKRGTGASVQEIALGEPIVSFGYSWTDAEGVEFEGLPQGLVVALATNEENRVDVSGTPTEAGVFNFVVKTVGGKSEVTKSGTITVTPDETGVEEALSSLPLRLLSNRVDEELCLKLNGVGEAEIWMYNISGEVVTYHKQGVDGSAVINLSTSHLPKGLYLVKSVFGGKHYEESVLKVRD